MDESSHQFNLITAAENYRSLAVSMPYKGAPRDLPYWTGGDSGPYALTEGSNWSEFSYLNFDIDYDGTGVGIFMISFHSSIDKETNLFVRYLLLPGLKTRISFPLQYLDANSIFMPRSPGRLKAVLLGSRIDPKEISCVIAGLTDTGLKQTLKVESIWLSECEPEPIEYTNPVVDELGQWTASKWPGKVRNKEDLVARLPHVVSRLRGATFPATWNKWGGSQRIRFEPKGFFQHSSGG